MKKGMSRRSVWSLLFLLVILVVGYQLSGEYIIPGIKKIMNFRVVEVETFYFGVYPKGWDTFRLPNKPEEYSIWLLLVPISAYFVICTSICFLIRIFKKLKSFKDDGLVFVLISISPVILAGVITICAFAGFLNNQPQDFIVNIVSFSSYGIALALVSTIIVGIQAEFEK